MIKFEGIKIRDEILADLKNKIADLSQKPALAIIWIGDDKVSARYIEQKQRAAEYLGVHFDIVKLPTDATMKIVKAEIARLNSDPAVTGLMIQLPIPENLDQNELISTIAAEKDVDALRFCSDLFCNFRPPVTAAIMEAFKQSRVDLKNSKIAIIGRGFLVGSPLVRVLKSLNLDFQIADDKTPYLGTITSDVDVLISAVGTPGLIKSNMVKKGIVLIDAGTTEVGGKLVGDIDPKAYEKSSFYTPVPGGIGPVTVAMLYKNLLSRL